MRLLSVLSVAAVLIGFSAKAETVNLQYMGTGNGRLVKISINSMSKNIFAGRLRHSSTTGGSPTSLVTFSTDVFQGMSNTASPYARTNAAQLSGNGGITNLGFARQQAIKDIFAAASNRQYTLGHDYATAFQVALWEIIYDYNPSTANHNLDVANGVFRAKQIDGTNLSASIREKIAFLLAAVGANARVNLLSFKSQGFGDQITIVPLPPGAWLGLGGIGLACLARRRFCRA